MCTFIRNYSKRIWFIGLAGIHVGNVISQESDKQDKKFKAQYNPELLSNFSFMSSPKPLPFTALRSVDLEEPVSQEEVASMTKAISYGVITAMGQFFNKHELADGGIWFPNDYRKHLRDERKHLIDEIDSEMDQSLSTGYAKDEFFEKTGRFTFKLREGKKASEALMSFLNGPTVADCGNATTACYYKCILDIIGEDKFNQAFGSDSGAPLIIGGHGITGDGGPISFLADFTEASKQGIEGVFGKRPLQIGDECHFDGVFWYGNKHPEGCGGGWNVIYIGDDADGNQLFTSHGFKKPLTEREINQQFIELYNRERTPQDDIHVIAARNPRLYDREINRFLKDSYTISPEEAERDPKRFIKGFLIGSIRNINAKELVKLNKTKNVSLFMFNRRLATLNKRLAALGGSSMSRED